MLTLHVASDTGLALLVYLINLAVASVLIGATTLLAHRLTRRLSLPLRHTLLLCGLAIATASPLLVGLVELADCSLVGIAVQQEHVALSHPVVAPQPPALPPMGRFEDVSFDERLPQPALAPVEIFAPPAIIAPNQPAPAGPSFFETLDRSIREQGAVFWSAVAMLTVWLIGGGHQLYRMAQGARYVRKLLGSTQPIDDARICGIASSAAQSVGLRWLPVLCQSPDIAAPLSVGLLRPRIVLPRCEACDWSDDQWRFLLLHEMAHLQRRDLWVGLLQRLALVIHWWNPLLHRVSTAISMLREQICDDVVAQRSPAAEGYPALIVELASRVFDRPAGAPVMGATDGSEHELLQRVRRMLDPNRRLTTSLNARTLGIAFAFAAILLLSLTGASIHRATASAEQVDLSKSQAEAPEAKPSQAEKKATPNPAAPAREMRQKTVRVVDAAGKPIAGATVTAWGMRVNGGHSGWAPDGYGESEPPSVKTDEKGMAIIPFPRFARQVERNEPEALTVRAEHSDYATSEYNEIRVTNDELAKVGTITLHHGAVVEASAFVGDQPLPMDKVRALWSGFTSGEHQKSVVNSAGLLQLPRLPAGTELIRLVYIPENGATMFSPVQQITLADGERRTLRFQMEKSLTADGTLDASVPRPVKNGRVVARVVHRATDAKAYPQSWTTWATIAADGSFKLDSLPGGFLQVIALCDGFMAKSGFPPPDATEDERKSQELRTDFSYPQVFPLIDETNRITVEMTPTADCAIRVLGSDGRPVAGARCRVAPNVIWWASGSQIYCEYLFRTKDMLTGQQQPYSFFSDQNLFAARTDEEGKALIRNIPPNEKNLGVFYDHRQRPIEEQQERGIPIELKAGQQTEVTVTLEAKKPPPDAKANGETPNGKAASKDVPRPAKPPREMLQKVVRVVDAAGNPIAGATVVPWAMQVGPSHGGWTPNGFGESEPPKLTTDQDGRAAIAFPRFAQQAEKNPPQSLTCRVSHPDYVESVYGDAPVTPEEVGNVTTIVLSAGAQIEAAAFLGEKRLPADQVRALWSSPTQDGFKGTTVSAAGWLVLPRLPAGAETVQLVHLPKDGPAMFSRAETLQLADGDRKQLTVQLEPAVRVVGRLDESAARPIKNGRVVVEVIQRVDRGSPPFIEWRSWAPIAADGSFVLESLPRGDMQVIALCDGYMAKSGAAPSFVGEQERTGAASFLRPQVFSLTKETNEITLAMRPTADCVIRVLGPDNRPVVGAKAGFWPNVGWWGGGSQIYAFPLYRSLELLTNPERLAEALKADQQPFSAVTDKDGKAAVHNLPSGENVFTVLHDDLGLPPDAGQNRFAKIDLKAGQPNEVTVTLVPKNPTPPEAPGNAEARKLEPSKAEAKAEAPAAPAVPPREMLQKTVRVVDAAGKPIAGATVTVRAMRVNQLQRPWAVDGFGESEPPVLTTDHDGKATIPFPRFAQQAEKNPPQALTFRVSHPDYIESANNDALLTAEELDKITTVALYPGAQIEAAAMVGDKRLPSEQVRALWSSPMGDGFQGVRVNAAGLVTLPRLPAGSELVQLVYRPKDGPAMFSRAESLTLTEGARVPFTPQMEPGARVVGRLDDSATRPIKNGRVVIQVMQRSANSSIAPLTWRSWTPVSEDGTFVFESLPRGDLQVIALCDGYMAASGKAPDFVDASKPNAIAGASLRPQVFPLDKEINEIVVAMTPTADCTVRAIGPDSRPVAGARIVTWPNVTWWGGDILSYETYAFPLYRTDELLDNLRIRIEARRAGHPFSATTDAEGIATIKNLPPRETGFSASFPAELIPNRMTGVANVSLKAGQPNEVTVTLKSSSASTKATHERLTKTVRVVDVAGKPVAGAKVVHVSTLFDDSYGLGDGDPRGLTTDEDGTAKISFNRYPHTKDYSKVELSCRVFHPNFAPSMDNMVPASGKELDDVSNIVLYKGARIEAAAYLGEERLPIERTFALWSGLAHDGYKDAAVNERGWLQLPPLAPGREKVQLVYIPKEGPVMFSQIEKVELADNQRPQLRLQMESSKRLVGKVDDSVRRPVKNGFVVVNCFQIADGWGKGGIRWQSWAPIAEDGSFAIESLPSGRLEAAGFCDAYMPTAVVLEESQVRDTVQLKKETTEITLRMTPTTDCAVRVFGPDKRPVAGAYCSFDSQTRRNAANFVYHFQLYRSQDLLADPDRWRDAPRLGSPFSAWTDAEGVAIVRNVGGDRRSFRVSHPTSRSLRYYGFADLEWGKRNEVTVTLTADR